MASIMMWKQCLDVNAWNKYSIAVKYVSALCMSIDISQWYQTRFDVFLCSSVAIQELFEGLKQSFSN